MSNYRIMEKNGDQWLPVEEYEELVHAQDDRRQMVSEGVPPELLKIQRSVRDDITGTAWLDMPKETPGPWYIDGHRIMINRPERAQLGEGAPETICEMNSSLSPEATAANARLMAHSPDLLAALERLRSKASIALEIPIPAHRIDLRAAIANAELAIAKAEGGR